MLTREITVSPSNPNDYEYPFPDAANARLYREYRERAEATPGLLICGRLGEYRYYDMDQAIARAQLLATRLLAEHAEVALRAPAWSPLAGVSAGRRRAKKAAAGFSR